MEGRTLNISGIKELRNKISGLGNGVIELNKALFQEANILKEEIQKRTLIGVTYNNVPFVPYSPAYAKYREKKLRSGSVNLNFTGEMMRDITVEKITNGYKIYFRSDAQNEKATWHNFGTKKLPQREFFNMNKNDVNKIILKLNRVLKRYGNV